MVQLLLAAVLALAASAAAVPLDKRAPALDDFLPTLFTADPPPLNTTCLAAASAPKNAKANVTRAWFAQTHLMETNWPFFNLVQERAIFMKLDVTDPAGGVAPQISVKASWTGGSGTACMVRPKSGKLPKTVDMKPQPAAHDLTTSYTLTIPSSWAKPGLALTVTVNGVAAAKVYTKAVLKMKMRPKAQAVFIDALLFGDTQVLGERDSIRKEFTARFPYSSVAWYTFNSGKPLSFPKIIIAPRGDGMTPNGQPASHPAVWADRKPSCTDAEKAASKCTVYSGYGVLSFTISLMGAFKEAFGMGSSSIWYAGHGKNSGLGGGLGGGLKGSGDDYQLIMNHELGHGMDLPHWGASTGSHQTGDGRKYPYMGDTKDGNGFLGGGFGKTTAYDALDNTLSSWKCSTSALESQDPMQRGCNNINRAKGRKLDHFSDFSALNIQRYWVGAKEYSGNVNYWSTLTPGSSVNKWVGVPFKLQSYDKRTQMEWVTGGTSPKLYEYDLDKDAYVQILRPPGSYSWTQDPPTAPAGSRYDKDWDFKFPIQWNTPIILVYGTFDYNNNATTAVLGTIKMKGHLKQLLDFSDPTVFANVKKSISGNTFWWGRNVHFLVKYKNGAQRYVAYPTDAQSGHNDFIYWAFNLPDIHGDIASITTLYRMACVRYGGMTDECNLNNAANTGVTAANFYSTAKVYNVWTAP